MLDEIRPYESRHSDSVYQICSLQRDSSISFAFRCLGSLSIICFCTKICIYRNYKDRKARLQRMLTLLPSLYFMSIIIDDTEQSFFTLAHFLYKVEETCAQGIKVHLIVLLHYEQGIISKCTLQAKTSQQDRMMSLNVSIDFLTTKDKVRKRPLHDCLFMQLRTVAERTTTDALYQFLTCPPVYWYLRSWKSAFTG